MQINPTEEWQSLTEHYRTMFDGELEELAHRAVVPERHGGFAPLRGEP